MFDKNAFKASIIKAGKTLKQLADALGINETTLYRKIGRNGDFSREEIKKISDYLCLDNPIEIFFK